MLTVVRDKGADVLDDTAEAAAPLPSGPLSVAAVAHRLGIAPATLRTWARRYGVGPSSHEAGSHRLYTPVDLSRLEAMRRLTLQGVPPGEAARAVTGTPFAPADPASAPLPSNDGSLGASVGRPRGGPGGRVLALPGSDGIVRGLGRAAMALDSRTLIATLRDQLEEHGVLHTWEHVLRPVLAAVGARWAQTGEGVEVEHLLSDCVTTALREVADRPGARRTTRPVLLASAPEEQHALPLHALAAVLGERGTSSRVLGANLPADALLSSVRRTGPAALFLWSQLPGTADVAVLEALPLTRPATAVVVGGPGWDPERLPARVSHATSLADARDLVAQALGA